MLTGICSSSHCAPGDFESLGAGVALRNGAELHAARSRTREEQVARPTHAQQPALLDIDDVGMRIRHRVPAELAALLTPLPACGPRLQETSQL